MASGQIQTNHTCKDKMPVRHYFDKNKEVVFLFRIKDQAETQPVKTKANISLLCLMSRTQWNVFHYSSKLSMKHNAQFFNVNAKHPREGTHLGYQPKNPAQPKMIYSRNHPCLKLHSAQWGKGKGKGCSAFAISNLNITFVSF